MDWWIWALIIALGAGGAVLIFRPLKRWVLSPPKDTGPPILREEPPTSMPGSAARPSRPVLVSSDTSAASSGVEGATEPPEETTETESDSSALPPTAPPLPAWFVRKHGDLPQVTLAEIQAYIEDFEGDSKFYVVDPSLGGGTRSRGGSVTRLAPDYFVRSRAQLEAQSIPSLNIGKMQKEGATSDEIRAARDEFIEEKLKPSLRPGEFLWLSQNSPSVVGPASVMALARHRALLALPAWLEDYYS